MLNDERMVNYSFSLKLEIQLTNVGSSSFSR